MSRLVSSALMVGIFLWWCEGTSAARQFIGVDACKMCHKSQKTGDQYSKWKASQHAKAFETLATPKAKELAAKAGVSGDPQASDKCLKCHVTGHGAKPAELGTKYKAADGVGCESCHGAGSDYKDKKVMEDRAAAVAAGLVHPVDEKVCAKCHNKESPTFKPFDFKKRAEEIAHPNPAKKP